MIFLLKCWFVVEFSSHFGCGNTEILAHFCIGKVMKISTFIQWKFLYMISCISSNSIFFDIVS